METQKETTEKQRPEYISLSIKHNPNIFKKRRKISKQTPFVPAPVKMTLKFLYHNKSKKKNNSSDER
jgi:hypothetical protein